jgi:hypothetical protein
MAQRVKIVWHEGNQPHVVYGEPLNEEDPLFISFRLSDGHTLRLNKAAVVKIEEVGS